MDPNLYLLVGSTPGKDLLVEGGGANSVMSELREGARAPLKKQPFSFLTFSLTN